MYSVRERERERDKHLFFFCLSLSLPLSLFLYEYIYIYIHVYVYRERETERARKRNREGSLFVDLYTTFLLMPAALPSPAGTSAAAAAGRGSASGRLGATNLIYEGKYICFLSVGWGTNIETLGARRSTPFQQYETRSEETSISCFLYYSISLLWQIL